MIKSRLLLAATLLSGVVGAEAEAQDRTPSLDWLTGCWEARRGTLVIEEHWLSARRGELLGVSRTMRGDSVVSYEFLRIYRAPDGLVLAASPSDQPPAKFRLASSGTGVVGFRNPDHDFPQHIRYRAVGTDSLIAEIRGVQGGAERRVEFPYARVACAGSGAISMKPGAASADTSIAHSRLLSNQNAFAASTPPMIE